GGAKRRETAPEAVDALDVAGGEPDHCGHVRRVPQTLEVRLRKPAAPAQELPPDARRADVHGRRRRARAVDTPRPVLDDHELPRAYPAKKTLGDEAGHHAGDSPGCG